MLALAALILTFGSVSGAHFNPAVTLAELATGKIDRRAVAAVHRGPDTSAAALGAVVANLMFDLPAVDWSTHDRITPATFLAEVVATFGLLTVIFGVVRSGRLTAVPIAVAGYIGAAYWFTSSTSFANPAVTIARTLSDTFAGIRPASAPGFIGAQLLGAALAVLVGSHRCSPNPNRHSRRPSMPDPDGRPTVLFLCVHNAGRSQMALGWFRHLAGDRAARRIRRLGAAGAR